MNHFKKKSISTLICITLISGTPGPAALAKETGGSTPSPAEYLKQVQIEGESIFGKNGCASLDEKGNVSWVSQTTRDAIEEDESSPSSVDCEKRIKAYLAHYKEAEKIIQSHDESLNKKTSEISNENCENCNQSSSAGPNAGDPEHQCSAEEKKSIATQRDKNPQCSINCELKGSLRKSLDQASFGLMGGLVRSSPSCKTDQGGTSPFGCMTDFILSLFSSLGSMCKAVWEGAKAAFNSAKDWVVGLFSSHSKTEEAATNKSTAFAHMSDEEIKEAQKNPEKANQGLLQKIGTGLNFILENIVGLDTPVYSELWQCAKCGERLGTICKIAGVVGKDVIKNAILIWIGGKAIQGLAGAAKGMLKGAALVGAGSMRVAKTTVKLISKTSAGRSALKWGSGTLANISSKSVNGFKTFMGSRLGKFSSMAASKSSKALTKILGTGMKAVGATFDAIDNVMLMPVRVSVRAGKAVAGQVKLMKNQSKIFARTPVLAAEDATKSGLSSLKDLPSHAELHLEIPSPTTPAMEKSKSFISSKLKGKGTKGFTTDIENAVEYSSEATTKNTLRVETPDGSKFIKMEQPDQVAGVHVFGDESNKAILKMKDGRVLLTQEGKVIKEFSRPEDIKKMDALIGGEAASADQMALQDMKNTAKMNGALVKEATASTESRLVDDFKVAPPKECGNTPLSFGTVAR
jgi:hypothetical protein